MTVEAQQKDEASILSFYKKLVAMRKMYPVIAKGEISFWETGTDMTLAYLRTLGEQNMAVLCNLSGKKQNVKTDSAWSSYQVLLQNYEGRGNVLEGEVYEMEPYEFLALGNSKMKGTGQIYEK